MVVQPLFDLQSARERRNLTRAQLAQKTGLSVAYIKVIELKGTAPSVEACSKLAAALDLPIENVVGQYRPTFLERFPPAKTPAPAPPLYDSEILEACFQMQKAAEEGLVAMAELQRGRRGNAQKALRDVHVRLKAQERVIARLLRTLGRKPRE